MHRRHKPYAGRRPYLLRQPFSFIHHAPESHRVSVAKVAYGAMAVTGVAFPLNSGAIYS